MNIAVSTLVLQVGMALLLTALSAAVHGEIYVYLGEDGERLVSDRPVNQPGYCLLGQRDTLRGAGRMVAGDPIDAGGPFAFRGVIAAATQRHGIEVGPRARGHSG